MGKSSTGDGSHNMSATALKLPYSALFHPFLTWLDLLVCVLLSFVLPLGKLTNYPAIRDDDRTKYLNSKLRRQLSAGQSFIAKASVAKWGKDHGEDIVEITLSIPRRPNVLIDWGICTQDDDSRRFLDDQPAEPILVVLRMPLSVAKDTAMVSKGRNEFGCRTLESIDLARLSTEATLVLYFHSGGFTIGTRDEASAIDFASAKRGPLILASVEYSLAPTSVFPKAVAEALIVVDYFRKHMPQHKLHVLGISAGGNLSAVAGMEMMRRCPDHLGSLTSLVPMLNPAADTESYYMNRTSSYVVPVPWLRWCWRCYLALPPNEADKSVDIFSLPSMEQRLTHESNQKAWAESSWRNTQLSRLVDPRLDLPPHIPQATPILILTNRADPLHDEGVKLVDMLRDKGANVTHIDDNGSHWMGTRHNARSYEALFEAWRKMIVA